ncbi:hypothetical protein HDV03_002413 [Kappamyces sp. JEL0829]|nr:hypothetical protein HDV03_002413 [Kappamyces sp. JEL0829]
MTVAHSGGDSGISKRPLNAFMLFKKEMKGFIGSQFRVSNSKDISIIAGQLWKDMSAAEKDRFVQASNRSHELWAQEKSALIDLGFRTSRHTRRNSAPAVLNTSLAIPSHASVSNEQLMQEIDASWTTHHLFHATLLNSTAGQPSGFSATPLENIYEMPLAEVTPSLDYLFQLQHASDHIMQSLLYIDQPLSL